VTFHRGIDGSEPIRSEPVARESGAHEERRRTRSTWLGAGTLACPRCDAPVALAPGPSSPATALGCPFCRHSGALRDFLSLTGPLRPARVDVRVTGFSL
jgi:hypothetical protein